MSSVRFKVESVTLTTVDETVTMVIEPVNKSDKLSEQFPDNLGRFSFRASGFRPGEVYELSPVAETPVDGNTPPPDGPQDTIRADNHVT